MVGNLEKVGIIVVAVFAVLAVISIILPGIDDMYIPLYGTDPDIIGYSPPSPGHILGTDFMGRDLFSQLCAGAYHAFANGVLWSITGIPVMVFAAFILAQLRGETPQLEDTPVTRFVRFVAFPLGVVGVLTVFTFLLVAALGRLSWLNIIFFAVIYGFLGWLAVGHDMEIRFRTGAPIPRNLFLSSAALIFSYAVIYETVMSFFGIGDPSTVTWGMMLQWCFTSGYTFKALSWLLPPIICTYTFSRGLLALSYGFYNAVSEKYFFIDGWF